MAKLKGLTLEKGNVSQTINLEDMFGVSFRGERELRLAIAQKVIEHIIDRTQKGEDLSGNSFKPYSKEYKATTEFRLLKDSTKPNLTLTGNMLADIDVLEDGPSTIQIGFTDETEKLKAYNHNTGDTVAKRPFFGVTQSEAREIIESEFGDQIDRLKNKSESTLTLDQILENRTILTSSDASQQLFIFNTFGDLEDEF